MNQHPNERWQWYFDQATDRLMLDMSQMLNFTTPYNAKQIIASAKESEHITFAFSIEDSELYYHFLEKTNYLNWPPAQQQALILNAIAACRFYKPLMPQSWFFSEQSRACGEVQHGDMVMLRTPFAHGQFMVIEASENASICINLTEQLVLTESRSLALFAIIKVMNNRFLAMAHHCDFLRQVG